MGEQKTESSFEKQMGELHYPATNISNDALAVWSQNEFSSAKGTKELYLTQAWKHASKQKGQTGIGKPEYTITHKDENLIIVVECKEHNVQHCSVANYREILTEMFKQRLENKSTAADYAIDGALHYASFIKDAFDVIVIGVSGAIVLDANNNMISNGDYKLTSFLWQKGTDLKELIPLEDGGYKDTFQSYVSYLDTVYRLSNDYNRIKNDLQSELKIYASKCNAFLRKNDINPEIRVSYIAGCLIALEDDKFRNLVKNSFTFDKENRISHFVDNIAYDTSGQVNNAQKNQWNALPNYKKEKLETHYTHLYNAYGNSPVKHREAFMYGDTILSTLVYSLYLNVWLKKKDVTGIDIMGIFYTEFLKYAKSDASDKSIVLTPKHIAELFCDLAEYYLGTQLDETTPVLDTCCGTGTFLIAALERMDTNIENTKANTEQIEGRKEQVRNSALIGIEKNVHMYALAYSNMNFHGDGKSNLYCGSSLIVDKTHYTVKEPDGNAITLLDKVKMHQPKIGFINPPYALDSDTYDRLEEKKKKAEIELGLIEKQLQEAIQQTHSQELIDILPLVKAGKLKEVKKQLQDKNILPKSKELAKVVNDKYKETANSKEIDFVSSLLSCMPKDGIAIVIMPVACGSKENQKRKKLLENNTLLAVMTMPTKLFYDSSVSTCTAIYVFKAGVNHNDYYAGKDNEMGTFFGRWVDDGYTVIPHNGRKDFKHQYSSIKREWFKQLNRYAQKDDTKWLYKIIDSSKEWCPEAYLKTDYSVVGDDLFINALRTYALYKYMDDNDLLGDGVN